MEERLDKVEETHTQMLANLKLNTSITQEIRDSAQPVLEAWATMQTGIRTIGKIGSFVGWWGRLIYKLGRIVVIIAAVYAGAMALAHGESIKQAIVAFWKALASG
jgi:hypothetical protein